MIKKPDNQSFPVGCEAALVEINAPFLPPKRCRNCDD